MFIVDADNSGFVQSFSKKQRALGSLASISRLSSSMIASRHVVLKKELEEVCRLYDIQPIYFSFEMLVSGNKSTIPSVIRVKEEMQRLVNLLKKDIHDISDQDLHILYELCTNIATKYTITELEQELLVYAGMKVVDLQKDEIFSIMHR